jgi:methylenetetrahydrofolate dehydrogenase (NADP+)/methenyltetrahydrofolate cyclohydrolase
MHSVKYELPAVTSQAELLALVQQLNADPAIHGILVQSPPPPQIDEAAIVAAIDPRKDVDGFHPVNVAKLAMDDPSGLVPCTPLGCQRLLIETGIETAGANVVVLGRSMIVGKPMALLLMRKGPGGDATVTVAHSRTRQLAEVCRSADILIAAIGRAEMVKADFVREGAVVIDVGINRINDPAAPKGSRLVGDVAFDEVAPKCRAITPVPGGVGPMTIAMLMANTVTACKAITA